MKKFFGSILFITVGCLIAVGFFFCLRIFAQDAQTTDGVAIQTTSNCETECEAWLTCDNGGSYRKCPSGSSCSIFKDGCTAAPTSACDSTLCQSWGACASGNRTRTCDSRYGCAMSDTAGCATAAVSSGNCVTECGAWTACALGGNWRTCPSGSGCSVFDGVCTAAPTSACDSTLCGAWGACASGTRVRTCASGYGCVTSDTAGCTTTASGSSTSCDSQCGSWNACITGGYWRSCPSGSVCSIFSGACTAVPATTSTGSTDNCATECGGWTACTAGGYWRSCSTASTCSRFKDGCTAIPTGVDTTLGCLNLCTGWGVCSSSYTRARTCPPWSTCNISQTCTSGSSYNETKCTGYNYNDWDPYCYNGLRWRSIKTMTPESCTDTSSAAVVRDCKVCDSYTYNTNTTCVDNYYTRTVTGRYPLGCTDDSNAVLKVACGTVADINTTTNLTCTSWDLTDWGECNSATKIRSRTLKSKVPSGCVLPTYVLFEESCIPITDAAAAPVCTSWVMNDWGPCIASTNTQIQTVASKEPSGCVLPATVKFQRSCQTDTTTMMAVAIVCNSWVMAPWSACNTTTNKQTSTLVSKEPAGCKLPESVIFERTCQSSTTSATDTLNDAASDCISWVMTPWSLCATTNKQTRTLVSKEPAGCKLPAEAISERVCQNDTSVNANDDAIISVPCTSWVMNDWGVCDLATKKQTRTVYSSSPSGCVLPSTEKIEQACDATKKAIAADGDDSVPCTYYEYSGWLPCERSGKQTRMLISKSPEGCKEISAPILDQACNYANLSIATDEAADTEELPDCNYEYSAWGSCVNGNQNRMVLSKSPAECVDRGAPILNQKCVMDATRPIYIQSAEAPKAVPESMLAAISFEETNLNGRTSENWQLYYFGAKECQDKVKCAAGSDPDIDGLSNNDEYRFGTDPLVADTDNDGRVDGQEIEEGRNPLAAEAAQKSDAMIFESAKVSGKVKEDIYQVKNVETVRVKKGDAEAGKGIRITGKALPNTYVTVYIYSDPIVLMVKTDENGEWSYVLDRPMEEGNHEVYVAVTDNTGKIAAKSKPLVFVQTAQAAEVVPMPQIAREDQVASPIKKRMNENFLVFLLAGITGLVLAVAAIGLIRSKGNNMQP